jgi:hypothetical protein
MPPPCLLHPGFSFAQRIVMKLCGWKTDSMFRRYAIVDERDLRSAVEMLAGGTTGAQSKLRAMGGWVMPRLSHCAVQCSGWESNPQGKYPSGF